MKHFTIENEANDITVYGSAKEADTVPGSERFSTEAMLGTLAANWPAARLVEIWNSLPGETPVNRFKDRATAVSRIWKAVQGLEQSVIPPIFESAAAESSAIETEPLPIPSDEAIVLVPIAPQTPDVAPEAVAATNDATRTDKAHKTAKYGPRENSKTSQVIAMLKREGGTTLEEIMTATGWQKHTVRGFIAILGKKGTKIESTRSEAGARTYKAA